MKSHTKILFYIAAVVLFSTGFGHADNYRPSPQSILAGDAITSVGSTDLIYPRMKMVFGEDGSTTDVSEKDPFPILIAPSLLTQENNDFVEKFGFNPDVDIGGMEDVMHQGGLFSYTEFGSGVTVFASSTSAGATNEITMLGLDANFDSQSTTFALTGTSSLAIPLTWIRVFRAFNSDSQEIAGDVYIFTTDTITAGVPDTADDIKIFIDADDEIHDNQSLMAIYTIPNGKIGLMEGFYVSSQKGVKIEALLRIRNFGKVFRTINHLTLFENYIFHDFIFPIVIPAKSDIRITVESDTPNSQVSGGFTIRLVDE